MMCSAATQDTVTTFGGGVDQTVATLQTAYDNRGRAYLFTSLGPQGNVLNQVERLFNKPAIIWRVDVVYLLKSDWKYEKSKAGEAGGGRAHTFDAPILFWPAVGRCPSTEPANPRRRELSLQHRASLRIREKSHDRVTMCWPVWLVQHVPL
jgi:hypothetical protein